jgi:hypothetical protein
MVSAPFAMGRFALRRNVTRSRIPQRVTVAHSPDADDAFMFYALAQGKVGDPDLEFVHVLQDIQTLYERAFRGEYEVAAVSRDGRPSGCSSGAATNEASCRGRLNRSSWRRTVRPFGSASDCEQLNH